MPVSLDDSDIVRVVNRGDKPYTIMYDSKAYKLEPGQDAFVPFPAAAVWFGDPRSTGNLGVTTNDRGIRTYIPDRETEVRRLRAKYDNQFGDETTIIRHPIVEVYAITGERITTVLDDPSGESVNVATQTVTEQGNMLSLIQAQQAQIEQLTRLVMASQSGGEQGGQEQPPTADDLAAALAGEQSNEQVQGGKQTDAEPQDVIATDALPIDELGGQVQTDAQADEASQGDLTASQEQPPQSQP